MHFILLHCFALGLFLAQSCLFFVDNDKVSRQSGFLFDCGLICAYIFFPVVLRNLALRLVSLPSSNFLNVGYKFHVWHYVEDLWMGILSACRKFMSSKYLHRCDFQLVLVLSCGSCFVANKFIATSKSQSPIRGGRYIAKPKAWQSDITNRNTHEKEKKTWIEDDSLSKLNLSFRWRTLVLNAISNLIKFYFFPFKCVNCLRLWWQRFITIPDLETFIAIRNQIANLIYYISYIRMWVHICK